MPTACVPASGTPLSITPTPAMPLGGTAFTSAATFSCFACDRSSADSTCTPAAAQARITSASASDACTVSLLSPDTPFSVTPKRTPVTPAAVSASTRPSRFDRQTRAPACAAITQAMRPTGPAPPITTTF